MRKHFTATLVLSLLLVFNSTVHATPDHDIGLYEWPRFWQWESQWADDHYAGNPNKKLKNEGCLISSLGGQKRRKRGRRKRGQATLMPYKVSLYDTLSTRTIFVKINKIVYGQG